MSSYQLGRVGIALLGLYFIVEILLAGISLAEALATVPDPAGLSIDIVLRFAAIAGLIFAVLGVLPAWILIRNRDSLARRWFSGGDEGPVAVSPSQFVEVGLVLLGIYLLASGVIGAVAVLATLFVPKPEGDVAETETDFVVEGGLETIATILAGVFLLRFANSLSRRLIA